MICDHIDADTLVRSLMYVNKQFYDIISDTYLWKKRVMRKFNDCEVAFMKTDSYNGEAIKMVAIGKRKKNLLILSCVSNSQKMYLNGGSSPGIQN